MKKTDLDDKLKSLNKEITSNKIKHVEAEKKITEKVYDFLLGRMYFTGNDG